MMAVYVGLFLWGMVAGMVLSWIVWDLTRPHKRCVTDFIAFGGHGFASGGKNLWVYDDHASTSFEEPERDELLVIDKNP